MKHAVLGPGGVGGLVGARLALAGDEVIFVVRPETLASYPSTVRVDSTVYGSFEAPVRAVELLTEPVDVLWVTCKATSLASAVQSAAPEDIGGALVVPLLNGLDHVASLRHRYGADAVAPGSIRTEAIRVAPGRILHNGWHIVAADPGSQGEYTPSEPVQLAADGVRSNDVDDAAAALRSAGIGCQVWADEGQVVWQKLAVLAPYALATTAVGGPIGSVRADEKVLGHLRRATEEAVAVAGALGVHLDGKAVLIALDRYPDEMRVSMERDLALGADLEIENIADPVIREGRAHGVSVASTVWLRERALRQLARRR